MIQGIRKVINIGSSKGITLPTRDIQREHIQEGDEVEYIIRPVRRTVNKEDQHIINTAKQILAEYKQDFQNLAKR